MPTNTKRTFGFLSLAIALGIYSAEPARALDAWRFAFDNGTSDPSKVADARANLVYDDVPAVGGGHIVRYLRIECFERSKATTRDQQTFFCYGEAHYCPTLPDGMKLCAVTLQYVILDFQGKLQQDGKSWVIEADNLNPAKSAVREGPSAAKFHRQLPAWAQTHLHLVSGYLGNNPGQPVVRYQKTGSEVLGTIVGEALSIAPGSGLAKNAIGEVIENLIKAASTKALENALQSDELRQGADYRIRDEEILKNKALYEGVGGRMWNF